MMLPRHGSGLGMSRRAAAVNKKHASAELPHERLAPKGRIPTAVDWRGTGADGIVKDQACTISCLVLPACSSFMVRGALLVLPPRLLISVCAQSLLLQCKYTLFVLGRPPADPAGPLAPLLRCRAPTGWPQVRSMLSHPLFLVEQHCPHCLNHQVQHVMMVRMRLPAGKEVRFSEQQLMDCCWKFGHNHACDGGAWPPAAHSWVTQYLASNCCRSGLGGGI